MVLSEAKSELPAFLQILEKVELNGGESGKCPVQRLDVSREEAADIIRQHSQHHVISNEVQTVFRE